MDAHNVYLPYGYHLPTQGALGFNGERPDFVTGHYHLGKGYRAYSPVLMRFNGPDSLSPFAQGGLNAYAYCQGDPVNGQDPSGHFRVFTSLLGQSVERVLVGFHATDRFNVKGLLQKVVDGFSRPGRQAQGRAFYIGPSREYVEPYRRQAIDGVTLAVVAPKGALKPGVHFTKDNLDVTAVKPEGYEFLTLLEEVPPDVKPANFPRTGIFATAGGAPIVKTEGAKAPSVDPVKVRGK